MGSRREDQFLYILTSDGSMDVYPGNKTSDFRIMLNNPIEMEDHENWEVSLLDINYPYSWTNVGNSARVTMKYFLDGKEHQILFPDWQCQTKEELTKFMKKKFDENKEKNMKKGLKAGDVAVSFDELGRFKMAATGEDFDCGFTDEMLRLLGLAGYERIHLFQMKSYEQRQLFNKLLSSMLTKPLDSRMKTSLSMMTSLIDTYQLMKKLLQPAYLSREIVGVDKLDDEGNWIKELDRLMAVSLSQVPLDHQIAQTLGIHNMLDFFNTLMKHYIVDLVPRNLRGVTPCQLNPVQRMYIYTNIIEPVDMNDGAKKLLKMVNTRGEPWKTTQEVFTHPTYMPVRRGGKIGMIHILICDVSGAPVSFQSGTVVLTLHFRKRKSELKWL